MRKMKANGQPYSGKAAEDAMLDRLEEREFRDFIAEDLAKVIKGRKYLSIRTVAKETRLLWIVFKWREALLKHRDKDAEYWGGKIEEYCMERAKSEVKIDGMEGANLLMEVVAKALIDQRAKRQIPHDAGNPGTGSPQVR